MGSDCVQDYGHLPAGDQSLTGVNWSFLKKIEPSRLHFWRKWLYWFGMALGASFFFYQIFQGIKSLTQQKIIFGQPYWIIPAFFLAILVTRLQMLAWQMLMTGLQAHLAWGDVLQGYVLSFIPRYIPGTVWGYITRGEWLNKSFAIPFGVTNLGSVLEMVFILIANLTWIASGYISTLWLKFAILIAPLCLAWVVWTITQWLAPKPVFLIAFGKEAEAAVRSFSLPRWLALTMLMIIFWGLQGLSFQMVIWSFLPTGQSLAWSLTEYWTATSSYNLAWFIGFIVLFVPAGLGLRETFLSRLIQEKLSQPAGTASVIAIAFRLVLAFGELIWALVALIINRWRVLPGSKPGNSSSVLTTPKK